MIHVQDEKEPEDAFHPLCLLGLNAKHMDEVLN